MNDTSLRWESSASARAKKASAFIVMAIMGGAVLPKLMGYIADKSDMSRGFIVPMVCFAFVAAYGLGWSRLSKVESLHGEELASAASGLRPNSRREHCQLG